MRLCPTCAHKNREGSLFCEECGQNLLLAVTATVSTKQINSTNELTSFASWGNAKFDKDTRIMLHIRDVSDPLSFSPDKRILLGRYDGSGVQKPDLDLTPYGALEKGVSRIHAAIYRADDTLTLVDMGSSNGTHLNGQRLMRDQPRVLRDGDEIRLGKLIAHIYFKQVAESP
ncbi:MAG: FHA domain-containing protein [Chloroflexota bacterium]|nr:FHA domain-containing protein [Chloroflexota bacterium]